MRLRDETGAAVDATVRLEQWEPSDGAALIFESRGGGRNNEYAKGLELVLQRLGSAAHRVILGRVEVASRKGTWVLFDIDDPATMLNAEADKARREISKRAAKAGRAPDAKGSGNGTKRLRLSIYIEPKVFRDSDGFMAWLCNDPPVE